MSLRFHRGLEVTDVSKYMNSEARVKWREHERLYNLVPRTGTAGDGT